MTHNEKRASSLREAQLALFTGSLYGATHTFTGHPLDTIKSKMQLQEGFTKGGMISVAKKIWTTEGIRGFFRGCVAPLWGSSVYRGVMMSGYEFGYNYLEKNAPENGFLRNEVGGILRPMVPLATVFSALVRGIFENPIEYAKVMGQTGRKWVFRDIYRGLGWQMLRTTGLLLPIFSILDIFRRKTDLVKTFFGTFCVTSFASGFAYLVCWPLETMKNMAQTATPHAGATIRERIAFLGGPLGIYRGVLPGVLAGGLRNGCAMVAMVYAQTWATKLGLRDE